MRKLVDYHFLTLSAALQWCCRSFLFLFDRLCCTFFRFFCATTLGYMSSSTARRNVTAFKKAQLANVHKQNKTKRYTDALASQGLAFIRTQNKTQKFPSFFKGVTQQAHLSKAIKIEGAHAQSTPGPVDRNQSEGANDMCKNRSTSCSRAAWRNHYDQLLYTVLRCFIPNCSVICRGWLVVLLFIKLPLVFIKDSRKWRHNVSLERKDFWSPG